MINEKMEEFYKQLLTMCDNKPLDNIVIESVLSLLNSTSRHETKFECGKVENEITVSVSVFGSPNKHFMNIIFNLKSNGLIKSIDKEDANKTIGEKVLDVFDDGSYYRYKQGMFKLGDVVARISNDGNYKVGIVSEIHDRDRYAYIHLMDDDSAKCTPGSIMENNWSCKRAVLCGTKSMTYLKVISDRELRLELNEMVQNMNIEHIVNARNTWERFANLEFDVKEEILNHVKAELGRLC